MTTPDAGPLTDARHVSTLSARHPLSRRQRLGLVVLAIVTAAAFLLTWRVSLAVI